MKKLITTAALFLALAFNVKANDLPRKEYPRPQFEREDLWGIERSGFFNGREKWAKGFENQRV